jgi:hypothetical protein
MPRSAACGLAPLASHRAMNWGGTSTSRALDGWNCGLGLDMTALRFARRPEWAPLANPHRIARRRVKVCVVRTTGPRRLDLDAPSTVRGWDDNGEHTYTQFTRRLFTFVRRICRRRHAPSLLADNGRPKNVHDASLMHPTNAYYVFTAHEQYQHSSAASAEGTFSPH